MIGSLGSPLAAALVTPSLFLGGAAAVSIPIIIHFFARRRIRRIRWAAVDFLIHAERANRRRVRLEELILLLLRCLAVFLIGLLLARPFVRPDGLAAALGGDDRTERLFLIDDSFSMGYRVGGETVFHRAGRSVKRLIELLAETSPNDLITVFRTSDCDLPVSSAVLGDTEQRKELLDALAGMEVSQRALSAGDVMTAVRRRLDEQSDAVNAVVYLVSDLQRKDWILPAGTAGKSPSAVASLADWAASDRKLDLVLINVGEPQPENVAVTNVASPRRHLVAGVRTKLNIDLANFAPTESDDLDLDVSVGASAQATVKAGALASGDSVTVPIEINVPLPGNQWVRIAAPEDALPIDDQRILAVDARSAVSVLIVDGEPSSDAFQDEVALLRTAIRPAGEIFSGNEPVVVDETELEQTDLEPFQVVIVANVYRISEPARDRLARFVRAGGGLAFFLGDQIDAASYNDLLWTDGAGLLPARLDERVSAPAGGVGLIPNDRLHPVVRVLAGDDNPFSNQVMFKQYFSTVAPDQADPNTATDVSVIARFVDPDATAAVIERSYGDGRVMLFTSSCDREWNDWGKDPSFVVAMLELVDYLAAGQGTSADLLVGTPLEIPLDPAAYDRDVIVRTPRYPAEQEITITAVPDDDEQGYVVRWDRTDVAGIYQFVLTRTDGEQEIRPLAVNVDPAESDVTPATEADLRTSLHEISFTYVDGVEALDEAGRDARRELWTTVLLTAFVVLMGEQLLGWWFGHRS